MNAVQPAYQPEENRREYGAAGRGDVGVRYERVGGAGVRAEGAGVQDGVAVDGRDDGDIRAMLDFVMKFVATKEDVANLRTEMVEKIGGLDTKIASLRTEMKGEIASLRAEMVEKIGGLRAEMMEKIGELDAKIASLRTEMVEKIASLRTEVKGEIAELRAEQKADKADLERRLDKLDARLDAQGKELAMIRRLLYGFFGAVISLLVAIMAGLVNGWFAMGG